MDETGTCYKEWSKSERKTPIQYINAFMWNLERGATPHLRLGVVAKRSHPSPRPGAAAVFLLSSVTSPPFYIFQVESHFVAAL